MATCCHRHGWLSQQLNQAALVLIFLASIFKPVKLTVAMTQHVKKNNNQTCNFYINLWASKMAQRIMVIATKLENLSSIPGIHMVKGHNRSHKLSSDFHTKTVANTHTHRHSIENIIVYLPNAIQKYTWEKKSIWVIRLYKLVLKQN